MIHSFNKLCVGTICFVIFMSSTIQAEDSSWPQFLGPTAESMASNASPLTDWDESNYIWETEIHGKGWSSPVYDDGRIWLTTAVTQKATNDQLENRRKGVTDADLKTTVGALALYAVCIDMESGRMLRNVLLENIKDPGLINPLNSYASPTPAIDGGKVVCHFGNYGTWCLDSKSGKELWQTKYEVNHSMGPGSSPVIHNGKVLLVCDGIDKQFVAAADLSSGAKLWQTPRPPIENDNIEHRKAYSTPLIAKINGNTQAIIPTAQWLVSYDPDSGEELWRIEHGTGFSMAPMASIEKGLIIFSTGYITPEFVAVDPTGTGDVTKTHIKWRAKQAPAMPSMITTDGNVYAVSDKGILSCIDAKSGKVIKRKRVGGNYSATPLLAGGNLYVCSREGVVSIIKCDETLSDVGKESFDGMLMATPAPIGNDLLIRTDKKLYRVGNKRG